MSHHNSSSSSSSTTSSRFPSYSKKKLLHLFNLRDPAVQAEKNQFTWGSHLGQSFELSQHASSISLFLAPLIFIYLLSITFLGSSRVWNLWWSIEMCMENQETSARCRYQGKVVFSTPLSLSPFCLSVSFFVPVSFSPSLSHPHLGPPSPGMPFSTSGTCYVCANHVSIAGYPLALSDRSSLWGNLILRSHSSAVCHTTGATLFWPWKPAQLSRSFDASVSYSVFRSVSWWDFEVIGTGLLASSISLYPSSAVYTVVLATIWAKCWSKTFVVLIHVYCRSFLNTRSPPKLSRNDSWLMPSSFNTPISYRYTIGSTLVNITTWYLRSALSLSSITIAFVTRSSWHTDDHRRSRPFYWVQLAEGGELFDHIVTHGRFNDLDARHMVSDITSAVAYIHSLNLVHRDLKPENLFVRGKAPFSPPFDLVVADFGVAVQLDSPNGQISGVCGSPGYTAPEVYRRQRYGKPVDMWSLGVITFIMLCGRFPFAHLQGPAFLAELDDPIRASSRFPKHFGLSRAAEDFIMRCLTVDPVERMTAEQAMNHEVSPQSWCVWKSWLNFLVFWFSSGLLVLPVRDDKAWRLARPKLTERGAMKASRNPTS